MIDIHIHTRFSFDSGELPENYIKAAKKLGISQIGFSEHYDYDAFLDGAGIGLADIDKYIEYLEKLRRTSQVNILCGIEFGYRLAALPEYQRLAKRYPFDYIINSVHTLPGRGDCFHEEFFTGKPLEQSYRDYFLAVLESVKCDLDYQIIGHIGYVSRYRKGEGAKINCEDYADILDEILKEIILRDKCLEINASVGSSGSNFLPDTDVILRYLQLGGKKLSFGSDAHSADRYCYRAVELKNFLKENGVNELYYYKKRCPVPYKI